MCMLKTVEYSSTGGSGKAPMPGIENYVEST